MLPTYNHKIAYYQRAEKVLKVYHILLKKYVEESKRIVPGLREPKSVLVFPPLAPVYLFTCSY